MLSGRGYHFTSGTFRLFPYFGYCPVFSLSVSFLIPFLFFFLFLHFCWESTSRRTTGRSAHLGPDQAKDPLGGGKKGRNMGYEDWLFQQRGPA